MLSVLGYSPLPYSLSPLNIRLKKAVGLPTSPLVPVSCPSRSGLVVSLPPEVLFLPQTSATTRPLDALPLTFLPGEGNPYELPLTYDPLALIELIYLLQTTAPTEVMRDNNFPRRMDTNPPSVATFQATPTHAAPSRCYVGLLDCRRLTGPTATRDI